MEIQQIRYVHAIAKYQTFSKAAESLFVTQPTLSQQIRKLEDELGFPLFTRSTRTVALTEEGKVFLDYSTPILEAYDFLISQMANLKKSLGYNIQVGLLPTFSYLNVLSLIHQFQSQHSDTTINFQIQSSHILLEMLLNNQLDFIIVNIPPDQIENSENELEIDIFLNDFICGILHENNALSTKTELKLSDLNNEKIILLNKKSSIRKHMEAVLKNNSNYSSAIYECPALHSMIGMVQANVGIGFLSSYVAKQYAQPPVVSIPLVPPIETKTAIIYKRKNPKIHILKELTAYIKTIYV